MVVIEGIQPLFRDDPSEMVPTTAEPQVLLSCRSATAALHCSISGGKVENDFSI